MTFLTNSSFYMKTIDEQLDAANAKVEERTGQLASAQAALEAANHDKAALEAVNAELSDNLTAAKDKLAAQEVAMRDAHARIEQLQAEAKSAEERAAEYYGTPAGQAAAVTPKGDPATLPIAERFKAVSTPAGQTQFIRSLSETERAELFSNL